MIESVMHMKKKRLNKQPNSTKASTIKNTIIIGAIALIAGLLIWLQIFPKPIEETIVEKPTEVEEVTKEVKPTNEIVSEKTDTQVPEGVVTKEITENTPEETELAEERVEERDQEAILATILPKVYTVYTESQQGSGFLYNANGDIVTNAHVVEGYSTVKLTNNTGKEFIGNVIGISDTVDVALIRVEEIMGKEPLAIDLMKSVEGTNVIAIGSPKNISNTTSKGKVTATGRDFNEKFTYTDLYEMDAPIAPGSSGGPLIDALTEKVIGINSIILTDNPAIGYSIPIYSVYQMLKSWEENPLTNQEPIKSRIDEAYFDEELLSIFIEGYVTLYTYAQNEANFSYLEGYLLPNSPIYNLEYKLITKLKDSKKAFKVEKMSIDEIQIEDERSLLTATIASSMTLEDLEPVPLKEQLVYEVIIDEYGDYMIQNVTKVNLLSEEEQTPVENQE